MKNSRIFLIIFMLMAPCWGMSQVIAGEIWVVPAEMRSERIPLKKIDEPSVYQIDCLFPIMVISGDSVLLPNLPPHWHGFRELDGEAEFGWRNSWSYLASQEDNQWLRYETYGKRCPYLRMDFEELDSVDRALLLPHLK